MRSLGLFLALCVAAAEAKVPPLVPHVLYPYGEGIDTALSQQQNYYHQHIQLNPPFNFFNEDVSDFYMTTNGAIFVGQDCVFCNPPTPCNVPGGSGMGTKIVGCFWADADPAVNGIGRASYRRTKDAAHLKTATAFLQKYHKGVNLNLANAELFIATWANVTYSEGHAGTPTNTFQCTLITDGVQSFVAYTYEQLTWMSTPSSPYTYPVIGLDDGQDNCQKTSLNASNTIHALSLLHDSNFMSVGGPALPQGQHALQAGAPNPPPTKLTIPQSTPQITCHARADPHFYSWDGQFVGELFRPTITYVTQKMIAGNWHIMAATGGCDTAFQQSGYPPFVVEMMPISCAVEWGAGVTCPGKLRVTFYMSALKLYSDPNYRFGNTDIRITLQRDSFILEETVHQRGRANVWGRSETLKSHWTCKAPCGLGDKAQVNYMIRVNQIAGGYEINTDFKFYMKITPWDSSEVQLPDMPYFKNNLFGFCGNNDGSGQNDGWCNQPQYRGALQYKYCWGDDQIRALMDTDAHGYFKCLRYPPGAVETRRHALEAAAMPKPDPLTAAATESQTNIGRQSCAVMLDPNGPFKGCIGLPRLAYIHDLCVGDVGAANGNGKILFTMLTAAARACNDEYPNLVIPYRAAAAAYAPVCGANQEWRDLGDGCENTCDQPTAAQFCQATRAGGCFCKAGYLRRGPDCVLPADCSSCLGTASTPIPVGGTWTSADCSQSCVCEAGGRIACSPAACDANAACLRLPGGPKCMCKAGYFGDGAHCSQRNYCDGVSCKNGGQCMNEAAAGTFFCSCQAGFTGDRCQTLIQACDSSPCPHGATCVSLAGGDFACRCPAFATGPLCEQKVNPCGSFPCLNLGTCTGTPGTDRYSCHCAQGYAGDNCQIRVTTTTTTTVPTTTTTAEPTTTTPRPTTTFCDPRCPSFGNQSKGDCMNCYWFCLQKCKPPFRQVCCGKNEVYENKACHTLPFGHCKRAH